ncbi:BrnT family toxin [Bacteroidota bacterium]
MYEFEWDINKSRENAKKHKISFDEAVSIFGDPLAIYFEDEEHSILEQRSKIIGISSQGKALLVVYAIRGNIVRIISTRLLTPKERKNYENKRK